MDYLPYILISLLFVYLLGRLIKDDSNKNNTDEDTEISFHPRFYTNQSNTIEYTVTEVFKKDGIDHVRFNIHILKNGLEYKDKVMVKKEFLRLMKVSTGNYPN